MTAVGLARPSRRQVLGYGAVGAAAALTGLGAGTSVATAAPVPGGVLDVYLNEGHARMVDGTLVYMRGFGDRPTKLGDPQPSLTLSPHVFLADGSLQASRLYPPTAPEPPHGRPSPAGAEPGGLYRVHRNHWASHVPRRTIVVESGAEVRLRLRNTLDRPRRFAVTENATTAPVVDVTLPAGAEQLVSFTPPRAGSYIYSDPGDGGVQRVLGLYGVLLVMPRGQAWRVTPGGVEFERQWVWICHAIDPVWGRRVQAGETVDPAKTPPVPRYFTLNNRSGYASIGVTTDEALNLAAHEETVASGYPRATDVRDFSPGGGGPTGQVLRLVNTGVAIHQLHWHGNHVWEFRRDNRDLPRSGGSVDNEGHIVLAQWADVVELEPMTTRDVVLPVKRPPDVPDATWAARDCDWHYPMHCHAEMSQTAGGGAYPGGLVGDWILAHGGA